MTVLELVPNLTIHEWVVLVVMFVVVVGIASLMAVADHVATQWQAEQYERSQPSTMGTLPPRSLGRVPAQRTGDDTPGDAA